MADGNQRPTISDLEKYMETHGNKAVSIDPDGTIHVTPAKAWATATSIVVGLTNNRQITFQSGHESDEDPEAVFQRHMANMRLADRMQAVYEIPEIEEELFKHRDTLANFIEDRDRLTASHEVQVDEWTRMRPEARAAKLVDMAADILKFQEMRAERFSAGLEAFRNGGRQGSYVPRGSDKVNLDRIDTAIKQAGEARDIEMERFDRDYDAMIAKAVAEKDQALANVGISIKRYEDAIAEREEKLARRMKTAEG